MQRRNLQSYNCVYEQRTAHPPTRTIRAKQVCSYLRIPAAFTEQPAVGIKAPERLGSIFCQREEAEKRTFPPSLAQYRRSLKPVAFRELDEDNTLDLRGLSPQRKERARSSLCVSCDNDSSNGEGWREIIEKKIETIKRNLNVRRTPTAASP